MSKNTANVEVNAKRSGKKSTKNVEAEQAPAKEDQKVVAAEAPQQKRGGRAKKQATPAEQPAPVADVKVVKKAGKNEKAAEPKQEVEAPAKASAKAAPKAKAEPKAKAAPKAKTASKAASKAASKEQSKEQSKAKSASKGKAAKAEKAATVKPEAKSKAPSKKAVKDEAVVEEPAQAEAAESADSAESKFEKLMTSLSDTRKNIAELQKQEKLLIKKLSNVHVSELKKASRRKRKPNELPTGFATEKDIGGKLADWLGVERGSKLTGPELSKKFWARIREDGLQYAENKRVLRTNKEVSAIFGVDAKVNKSIDPADEHGFNMRTYQTHIAYALEHNNQ